MVIFKLQEAMAVAMLSPLQRGWPSQTQNCESPTGPLRASTQLPALLWGGAILRARSLIMCHSGCCGPLPGSGHYTLPAPLDRSLRRNSTPTSKQSYRSSLLHGDRRTNTSFFEGNSWIFPVDSRMITPLRLST